MRKECPICQSENVRVINFKGSLAVICNECGYDEREDLETGDEEDVVVPEERTSQKAKKQHTPYKTGGPKRTQKKK